MVERCRRMREHAPHRWGVNNQNECPGVHADEALAHARRRMMLDAEILDAAREIVRSRPGSPTDPIVLDVLRARAEALRLEAGAT